MIKLRNKQRFRSHSGYFYPGKKFDLGRFWSRARQPLLSCERASCNQQNINTSSNQRLGVRSVVLWKYASVVELIIFMWTAEVQIYWQSPLLFCGLFDFFALWLARDVSPAAGELRFDDLWWHVAWRVSGNICLWLFMLNISVSLSLVMFKHKGQYFKTNTSVTSSMLSWKHTYQLTSTTSVTFALACRFIPGFS